MGKTKNATKPLTDAEIWDDSALVRTWDEAFEEYKLYHSIHAKGENVEDALRDAEAEEAGETTGGSAAQETDTADVDQDVTEEQQEQEQEQEQEQPSREIPTEPELIQEPGTGSTSAAAMPHPAMASVQDEGLKNLMMSWYFAGYYTGLYEGQQKANQSTKS